MSEKSNTPSTQNPKETTQDSSQPPSSQQPQNEKESPVAEKSETEISKDQSPIISTTNDGKPKLGIPQNHQDFVVQITNVTNNASTREETESNEDQDININNLNRKLSNVEEDVCYPLRPDKMVGIDYDALEEYIIEEKTFLKGEEGLTASPLVSPLISPILSPVESEPKKSSVSRRVSEFGERIKNPIEITDEFRFVFHSVEAGTIKAKTLGSIPPKGKSMSQLLKQGVFWIDVLAPTESEIRILSRIFHIHPLTMEDIEMEEAREKCETFKDYYFVCFRAHNNDPSDVEPISMYNVVMREGILTFHFQPVPHPQNVRRRIQYLKDYITVTPDWINYAIMDDITDSFAPLIHKVEFESDAIDQLVMVLKKSEQQDMLVRIGLCRKTVMTLLKMLGAKVDVIKGLIKRFEDKLFVSESDKCVHEVSLYLGDVQDHIITMLQNLSHYENMLSRAHSNYLAQISIEITQLSNMTNDVLNRMTVFATILLPMNVVTGLFGMNVHVPGQDGETLAWFCSITSTLIVIGMLGWFLAKKVGLM